MASWKASQNAQHVETWALTIRSPHGAPLPSANNILSHQMILNIPTVHTLDLLHILLILFITNAILDFFAFFPPTYRCCRIQKKEFSVILVFITLHYSLTPDLFKGNGISEGGFVSCPISPPPFLQPWRLCWGRIIRLKIILEYMLLPAAQSLLQPLPQVVDKALCSMHICITTDEIFISVHH